MPKAFSISNFCGGGRIRLRIKFCRHKIFPSRASRSRKLARHRSGVRIPHAKLRLTRLLHFCSKICGGGRIRTPDTLRYAGFRNRCIQPLCHASVYSLCSNGGRLEGGNVAERFSRSARGQKQNALLLPHLSHAS